MKATLRHGKWTPAKKATVRFLTPPPPRPGPGLETRIAAAKLTALRARETARQFGETTDFGQRMLAQAATWEKRAEELARIQRGRKSTVTITLS